MVNWGLNQSPLILDFGVLVRERPTIYLEPPVLEGNVRILNCGVVGKWSQIWREPQIVSSHFLLVGLGQGAASVAQWGTDLLSRISHGQFEAGTPACLPRSSVLPRAGAQVAC